MQLCNAFIQLLSIIAFSHVYAAHSSSKVCPLLGPAFPAPSSLSSDDSFNVATSALTNALEKALRTGSSGFGNDDFNGTTFSIGMFNGYEDSLLYQFHHTSPGVANGSVGTRKADADSIYRIASISKLLTTYTWLIQDGDAAWNDAVTKYIPELRDVNVNSPNGKLPDWTQITIGDLASQLSGISNIYGQGDLANRRYTPKGFPSLPQSERPLCNFRQNGTFLPCTRESYFPGFVKQAAEFPTAETPIYSNSGFDLLGFALEDITHLPMDVLLQKSLVDALGLNGTTYTVPASTDRGVIPNNEHASSWDWELGVGNPDGGYFSSTNDFAAIGRSILKHTLISPSLVRRWLKPKTFTSDWISSVGAPWEIYRAGSEYVHTFYTKGGSLGAYFSLFVLIPDFNFGFSVLTAGPGGGSQILANIVSTTILPALENIAKSQAKAAFAGLYKAEHLNSSIEVTVDDQPGLQISSWVSNGTDMLSFLAGATIDFRLFPNDLYTASEGSVGFTGSYMHVPYEVEPGPFSDPCWTWIGPGSVSYGNVAIENFVFEVNPDTGDALRVLPKALRISLEKQRDT